MAAASSPAEVLSAEIPEALTEEFAELGLDDFDFSELQQDEAVQEALRKGTDLRSYAGEVEAALRAVERESIHDYIKESENLAGLHTQIRDCDNVLNSMEQMLRGFQSDLGNISAQIKYLQDESLSMNVKLRNRKEAEAQLSTFIHQIVIAPELIQNICDAEVNETYLEFVTELDEKLNFSKQESTVMTSACSDIAPEIEKLRLKAVQKIYDFFLSRVAGLKKSRTNIQILQQSVLLKHKGLFDFLQVHAPEQTAEVKESYTTTMSAMYLRQFKSYLTDLMRVRAEVATKADLLGVEEWGYAPSALFSSKPEHARGDGAFKVANRRAVLGTARDPPLPAAIVGQEGGTLFYEEIFRSVGTLLLDAVSKEYDFMSEFFGSTEAFDNIFGKSIFHTMENLEQHLASSWDAVGCLLLLHLYQEQRQLLADRQVPLLANFFERVQVLVWGRFKTIMEAHVQSLAAYMPKTATVEIHPHFVTRRYAELVTSLRLLGAPSLEPMLSSILRAMRTEAEKLLAERLARQHPTRMSQSAFLINNYDVITSTFYERGARGGEDSAHFEQLLDSIKSVFVEEVLMMEHGRLITYVKQTEPLLMQGASESDAARVDTGAMEALLRAFFDTWKEDVKAINGEVFKTFANFKLGMDLLKQVLTQLLLYYTRFLDIVKRVYPEGAPFAQYILSIPTLMKEIKTYSQNF